MWHCPPCGSMTPAQRAISIVWCAFHFCWNALGGRISTALYITAIHYWYLFCLMFGAQVGCGRRGFVARPSRIGFLDRPQGVCLEAPVPDAGVRSQQEDGGCTVAIIQYLYIILHTCTCARYNFRAFQGPRVWFWWGTTAGLKDPESEMQLSQTAKESNTST